MNLAASLIVFFFTSKGLSSATTFDRHQVALCFSGKLRGANERLGELQEVKAAAHKLWHTQVFASIHLDDSPAASSSTSTEEASRAVSQVVRTLVPAAWETYDSGDFTCAPRSCRDSSSGGKVVTTQAVSDTACTFLIQFSGVRRSFRLMEEHELRTGMRFDMVVRFRFDISCINWQRLVPATYPLLSPPTAGTLSPLSSSSSSSLLWFLGSSRHSAAQQVSEYDWADFAWIVSRGLAETVFTSVEEFDRSTSSSSSNMDGTSSSSSSAGSSSSCLGP